MFIKCECGDASHVLIIDLCEWTDSRPDLYIQTQLDDDNGFWKRIWLAIKFVFQIKLGKNQYYWADTVVSYEDAVKLKFLLNDYIIGYEFYQDGLLSRET